MSKAVWTLALILASSFVASAQDAAKKDAPKQALSASQAVLETWNDVGRKLTTMAEDFPENKYDFKPTPAQDATAEPAKLLWDVPTEAKFLVVPFEFKNLPLP